MHERMTQDEPAQLRHLLGKLRVDMDLGDSTSYRSSEIDGTDRLAAELHDLAPTPAQLTRRRAAFR